MGSIIKYIRTENGIFEFRKLISFEVYLVSKRDNEYSESLYRIAQENIIKESDTIEKLCDKFVIKHKKEEPVLLSYRDFKRHFDLYNQEYSKVELSTARSGLTKVLFT